MYKPTNAVLRFKVGTRYAGHFILRLTSDKGFEVVPPNKVDEAMVFTTKKAAESYLPNPRYAYFANDLEAVTFAELEVVNNANK
jgi:hypothetical protein